MVRLKRMLRHVFHGPWSLKRRFPARVLAAIETAVVSSETRHGGEIRFVIESALPLAAVVAGQSPRERAVTLFSQLGVWDTDENNGVLLYILLADRDVEVVADRGLNKKISPMNGKTFAVLWKPISGWAISKKGLWRALRRSRVYWPATSHRAPTTPTNSPTSLLSCKEKARESNNSRAFLTQKIQSTGLFRRQWLGNFVQHSVDRGPGETNLFPTGPG
jgi:hypothetical protein